MNWRWKFKSVKLLLICLGVFSVLCGFNYMRLNRSVGEYFQFLRIFGPSEEQAWAKRITRFLLDSNECLIPDMDPWDPVVREHIRKLKPIDCRTNGLPVLIESNATSLFVVEDALPFYNATFASLLCCYSIFYRGDDFGIVYEQNECKPFIRDTRITDEFVQVNCYVGNVIVYKDHHVFFPRKPAVEQRCNKASPRSATLDDSAPSVLVLGMDSVSRLNLHRLMPRTVQLLREMGAVEMLGYNKVGDNTYPNINAALTGLHESELKRKCWPTLETPYDNCPFVWKEYRDAGFRTVLSQENIFRFRDRGFVVQPTDYYLRPLEIYYYPDETKPECFDSRLKKVIYLKYVSKFVQAFKADKYFAFLWSSTLSHDDINYPSLGDELYAKALVQLRDTGALERTVLVVMSDHGFRWGPICYTRQGYLEERLPFLFLVFPARFRERYPAAVANVERNARRLTTPFDLFESLRDLVRPALQLEQGAVRRRSEALAGAAQGHVPRGISLFLEVPRERSCEQAGIAPHWCTCHQSSPVDRYSPVVRRIAYFVVKEINEVLQSFPQCGVLFVDDIKHAELKVPTDALEDLPEKSETEHYLVVVSTSPGDAVFEASVNYNSQFDNLSLVNHVSRISRIGLAGKCVKDYPQVEMLCYCL